MFLLTAFLLLTVGKSSEVDISKFNPSWTTNLQPLEEFLNIFQSSENFSYVNILYQNSSNSCDNVLKFINLPKIVLKNNIKNSSPRYNRIFFSIVFIDDFQGQFTTNFFESFFLNTHSKILFIYEKHLPNLEEIFQDLYGKYFYNCYIISMENILNSKIYHTYRIYPRFSVENIDFKNDSKLSTINLRNVSGADILILCTQEIPTCMSVRNKIRTQEISYFGIYVLLFRAFSEFVHGKLQFYDRFYFEKFNITYEMLYSNASVGVQSLKYVHFSTAMDYLGGIGDKYEIMNIPLSQIRSEPLERDDALIIVPAPRPLKEMQYPYRPLENTTRLVCIFLLFYTTGLMTLSLRLADYENRPSFLELLFDIFRAILSQSFTMKIRGFFASCYYIIIVEYGFIFTLWYCAILGSLITSVLYEEPIESLSDLREAKLTVVKPDFYMFPIDKLRGMRLIPERESRGNIHYAYGKTSLYWNYYLQPMMQFYRNQVFIAMKEILGSSFAFIFRHHTCIFKKELDRFLQLSKDTGLYIYWCERFFVEFFQYNKKSFNFHFHEKKRILSLNYFRTVYFVWGLGILFSCLAFLIEILKFRIKKKMLN